MSLAGFIRLARHVVRLARAGQLRFRAETFGLYYPSPQYAAAWWRVSPRTLVMLARRGGKYGRWLGEMENIARMGGSSWWDAVAPQGSLRAVTASDEVPPIAGLDSSQS